MLPRACALVALVAALVGAACGGKVGDPAADSGTADGSSSSGSGSSSGAGHGFGLCPSEAPSLGDACGTPNQGCIYLSNGACVAFVCNASGHWVSTSLGC
jgi:hypothetical protein